VSGEGQPKQPWADVTLATAPPVEDLLELERQVCFALAVASRSVIGVYRPVLEPLRLTHPQYLVMLALWQYAPLSVTALGRLLQLEPATLSPLLKRLEAVGYVERRRVPGNERALRLTLTPQGTALRERAIEVPRTVMQRLRLDLADAERLHAVLTEVIGKAQQVDELDSPVLPSERDGLPLD
jgi:DNA-binding MarR family transcriptional regulator